jgi:hypothetical protein
MVAEIGARVEPHIENFAERLRCEVFTASGVHKTDYRNFLFGERAEQLGGDAPDSIESAWSRVAATEREIVNCDGYLTVHGLPAKRAGER